MGIFIVSKFDENWFFSLYLAHAPVISHTSYGLSHAPYGAYHGGFPGYGGYGAAYHGAAYHGGYGYGAAPYGYGLGHAGLLGHGYGGYYGSTLLH